jgi:fatty acid desaturase
VTTALDRPARSRTSDRVASEYSTLLHSMQKEGLMRRRYGYYAVKGLLLLAALAGVWVAFAFIGDHWAQVAIAVALAVVLTQIVFLSHDAAHRQIFQSNRANELAALLMGTLIGGVSLSWWNNKHNKHHATPNTIGKDSDISPSVVHFYPAPPPKSAVGRFLREHQGWWFFPLLMVEALNLHAQSAQAVVTRKTMKRRRTEMAMLAVRFVAYSAVLFVFLPAGLAAVFLVVQLAVMGLYLGGAFSAAHIGMPVLPHDSRMDFLRRQVLLSRNVSGGGVASVAMGGLNYQIEHHLFPSMPRPNLRRARPIVRAYCEQMQIAYHEVTILRAWAIVASYLNRVGLAGRDAFQCPVSAALR